MSEPNPNMVWCAICHRPMSRGHEMCALCRRSYDKHAHDDDSVMGAMRWAADRARRYEHKRMKALGWSAPLRSL